MDLATSKTTTLLDPDEGHDSTLMDPVASRTHHYQVLLSNWTQS